MIKEHYAEEPGHGQFQQEAGKADQSDSHHSSSRICDCMGSLDFRSDGCLAHGLNEDSYGFLGALHTGVEEKLHFSPPNISSISLLPILSKSSGTEICP